MQKTAEDKTTFRDILTRRLIATAAFCLAGFFMGRIVVFSAINPVAVAYAIPFIGKGKHFYVLSAFTAAGLLTRFNLLFSVRYLMAFTLLCGANFLFGKFLNDVHITIKAAIGAVIVLACGLIFAIVNQLGIYYILMAMLQAVLAFSLSLVIKKGTDTLLTGKGELGGTLSTEDTISVMVIFGAVIAGASDIFVGWFSFLLFLCPLLVLVMAYGGGAAVGAAGGLLVGLLLSVSGMAGEESAIIYGTTGLLCGAFREMGKLPSAVGLFGGAGLALYFIGPSFFTVELLFSLPFAITAFYFMPDKFVSSIYGVVTPAYNNAEKYAQKVKELTANRLQAFSGVLSGISKTFGTLSAKKESLTKNEANRMVDDIVAHICADCKKCHFCWQENFFISYKGAFAALQILDSGSMNFSSVPAEFVNECIRYEEFLGAADRYFDKFRLDLSWQNKLIESRKIVAEQLSGVADIANEMALSLTEGMEFSSLLEGRIIEELARRKVEPESIIVRQDNNGRYEVYITHPSQLSPKHIKARILPAVSSVLTQMEFSDDDFIVKRESGRLKTYITLSEKRKFTITHGIAHKTKEGSKISGDSHSLIKRNADYVFALSDGMGSGPQAKKESSALLGLFEDYTSAGFSTQNALKLINSALLMKAGVDSFATLDICTVNLYTGLAEFIKLGAASTYIISESGIVEPLRSRSLPAGAVVGITADSAREKLSHGDTVIMATDGVSSDEDSWFLEALRNPSIPISAGAEHSSGNPPDSQFPSTGGVARSAGVVPSTLPANPSIPIQGGVARSAGVVSSTLPTNPSIPLQGGVARSAGVVPFSLPTNPQHLTKHLITLAEQKNGLSDDMTILTFTIRETK